MYVFVSLCASVRVHVCIVISRKAVLKPRIRHSNSVSVRVRVRLIVRVRVRGRVMLGFVFMLAL